MADDAPIRDTLLPDPLLDASALPFGAPAFDRIDPAAFLPALDVAIAEAVADLDRIAGDAAPATFDGVIVALERAGERLARVRRIFWALSSAQATDAIRAIEGAVSMRLTRHGTSVAHDAGLFARVHAVWRRRDAEDLTEAQRRLLADHYRGFVDGGALLDGADKTRFAAIVERLSALSIAFGHNVLAATADWSLALGPDDLDGLPEALVGATARRATAQGRSGHVLTLDRGIAEDFLAFSRRRDLREAVWRAFAERCNGGAHDNRAIVREIVALRQERARLLGHASYADFALVDTMAATPAAAESLLLRVWRPALARAQAEQHELEALARADGVAFAPWDWRFYAEAVRRERLALDGGAVKAWLTLDVVRDAIFLVAGRLYGLWFEARPDLPGWHADVAAWAVRDADGGDRGLLYTDFYARPEKHGGAWMGSLRVQERLDDTILPIVYVCANFAHPPAGGATGLSVDEARTLFHEFGHALHALLSDVTYPGQSGTAVTRDFVELPSKFMEHWIVAPALLTELGVPASLAAAIGRADDTGQGFATIEFLASAIQDLAIHRAVGNADPYAIAADAVAAIGMPATILPRHGLSHFTHVFDGGYASLYYSYLWSEMLDADAFDAFVAAGDLFDADLAHRFRSEILARGDTRDPMDCFIAFRGRAPDVDALLRQRGFVEAPVA
ncbi:M3 family metallopeptidase [uncultured Sphingomonas sp.]|uniref:M3 family metallopeptidase n=1 Tax=uncultured Sphingomonas sp. TaxID=158754 RepID=UPI0035C9BA55